MTEFKCAVYADGELPASEAREIAEHLEVCASCRRQVEALREESRVLVYCLQETDFIEFELEDETLTAPQAKRPGLTKLSLFVLAMSVLLRPVTGILAELELPESLNWLNPFSISTQLSLLMNAVTYGVPAAIGSFRSFLNTAAWTAFGSIVFFAILLLFRPSLVKKGLLSIVALLTVFSSSSYGMDVREILRPQPRILDSGGIHCRCRLFVLLVLGA